MTIEREPSIAKIEPPFDVRVDHSPPVEGCQAKPDGVVFCVPTNFPKTVGADLYIHPQRIVLAYNIVYHLIHRNDHYVAQDG